MVIYQSDRNAKSSYFQITIHQGEVELKLFGKVKGAEDQLISIIPIPDPETLGRDVLSTMLGYDDWVVYVP